MIAASVILLVGIVARVIPTGDAVLHAVNATATGTLLGLLACFFVSFIRAFSLPASAETAVVMKGTSIGAAVGLVLGILAAVFVA